jgi:hypothetical protein
MTHNINTIVIASNKHKDQGNQKKKVFMLNLDLYNVKLQIVNITTKVMGFIMCHVSWIITNRSLA